MADRTIKLSSMGSAGAHIAESLAQKNLDKLAAADFAADNVADGIDKVLAEVERLRARFDWIIDQLQKGDLQATHNTVTGFFLSKLIYKGSEAVDRKRLAYAPRNEGWGEMIDRAMSGENPDETILKEIRAEKAGRREGRDDGK